MTMNRWHWMMAAEIILAAGVAGEAGAQPKTLPQPRELPAAQETIVVTPAPRVCVPRRTPVVTFWNRAKGRLERWFVSEEPDAVPLGQSVYQAMTNQVDQGVAARLIMNDFDFKPNSADLNQRGKDKLKQVAMLALRYPYALIVERTDYSPGLDKVRRQTVVEELKSLSIPLPADRIEVGLPRTPGLSGVEAYYLYGNLFQPSTSAGTAGSSPGVGVTTGTPGPSTQTPGSR